MDKHLRDELIRFTNVYRNNANIDIANSQASEESKKLAETMIDNVYNVLIAFSNEVAKSK